MDVIIASTTPTEYRQLRERLAAEGLWDVAGQPAGERRSAERAEQILRRLRSNDMKPGMGRAAQILEDLLRQDLETEVGGSEDYRDGIRAALDAIEDVRR
jgi:hypothetical protein